MKKLSLFCTNYLMYLTELPVILLLIISIKYNSGVDATFQLYPLIIALIGVAVFILIYLFRVISISTDMIKAIGPFSSREKAIIKEDKLLVLTSLPRGKVKIELFGTNEKPPELDWAVNEDRENLEINLFRERCMGGGRAIRRVLKYFAVPESDIDAIFTEDKFKKSYKSYDISAEKRNEIREVKIKFTETI